MKTYTLAVTEAERQVLLLALAKLSIERPGWDHLLSDIAQRIDNRKNDRPEMYDDFRRMHVADVEEPT